MLNKLGLDKTEPVNVKGVQVSRATSWLPAFLDPATLGDAMHGATCAGLWVTGTGKDGKPRELLHLYHVVDNQDTVREYGTQCVVWQTAINPVVALELLAAGTWSGAGVLGPEAFDAVPFLNLLADDYRSPWGLTELDNLQELAHAYSRSLPTQQASFRGHQLPRWHAVVRQEDGR